MVPLYNYNRVYQQLFIHMSSMIRILFAQRLRRTGEFLRHIETVHWLFEESDGSARALFLLLLRTMVFVAVLQGLLSSQIVEASRKKPASHSVAVIP